MRSLANKQVKIVEKFKIYIIVSLVIVLAGIVMLAVKGMNVGIDFSGGAQVDIELSSFATDGDAKQIIDQEITKIFDENGLKKVGALQTSQSTGGVTYEYRLEYYHNGEVKGEENELEFMSFISDENGICDQIQGSLEDIFANNETLKSLGATIEENSVKAHSVGATASGALLRNATIALIGAIIVMLIYILIRFKFAGALASICALVHDVLVMIALTVIFQIPVNSTFIAAVITIVGYSINATIVIFDRIREEIKFDTSKSRTDVEIANYSIVKTLGRSILTTLTTLVTVLFLAFFSVPTIREFIIPIIFGLLAGTYSSVFLASSFWVMFRKIGAKKRAKKVTGYQKTVKG